MPLPKYQKYLDIDLETFNKLDMNTLKGMLIKLNRTANTRLRSLKKAGYDTPASRYYKFGVRGQSFNQLKSSYMRVKQFLGLKTSTIRGANAVMKQFYNRVGVHIPTKSQKENYAERLQETKKFWEVYNKLNELYNIGGRMAEGIYDSTSVQEQVQDAMKDTYGKGLSVEDILDIMRDRLDKQYESYDVATKMFK